MDFYCIADEDTVRAFRLAGVTGEVACSAPETAAAIERAAARQSCGILIITRRLAAGVRAQVDAIRLERGHPLIVEIPGPGEPQAGRKSLRDLVQQAVGIKVERKEGE
ncbi:MAG: V-type ATP synthase subunit F [bacterium]